LDRARAASVPRHPSHVPEIASRLFISRNTAKTEAVAIYRKFGVSSRGKAIERAIEVGLVEDSIYPPRADFVQ
jgi:LuxR family maltose regulon positive regulatory protein